MKMETDVIYLIGSGHSGSTLLNLILGIEENVFSAGELKYLYSFFLGRVFWENGSKFDLNCDCGYEIDKCKVWSKVLKNINLKDIYQIEKKGVFVKRTNQNSKFVYQTIYSKLRQVTSAKYIVDSSKDLRYFSFINSIEDLNIFPILIIRDGRGVINSDEKTGVFWLKSYFLWLSNNIVVYFYLKKKYKDFLILSYDEFVQNPSKYINIINQKFNFHIPEKKDSLLYKINTKEFHNFAGNKIRWKKIKSIKYDQSWKRRMPKWKQLVLTVLCYIPNKLWVYNKK